MRGHASRTVVAAASTISLGGDPSGAGRSRERVGDAGELLDDAVMEIAGDLTALDLGCLQRPPGERLPFANAVAEPAGERAGERDLDELEHDESAERDRGEAAPEPGAARRDHVVAVIGLEQQGVGPGLPPTGR